MKKTIAKLSSKFKKLLTNSKFHSHLASGYFHPCRLPSVRIWHAGDKGSILGKGRGLFTFECIPQPFEYASV
jgi:thiamine biosynthesis lipoprotein ApbE